MLASAFGFPRWDLLAGVVVGPFTPRLAGLLGENSGGAASGEAREVALALAVTFGKVAAFVALMFVVGRRAIPLLLHYVAKTGSHELFRLAVLALALEATEAA